MGWLKYPRSDIPRSKKGGLVTSHLDRQPHGRPTPARHYTAMVPVAPSPLTRLRRKDGPAEPVRYRSAPKGHHQPKHQIFSRQHNGHSDKIVIPKPRGFASTLWPTPQGLVPAYAEVFSRLSILKPFAAFGVP
jgi:hypothetical protein